MAVDALEDGTGTWDAVRALRDRALVVGLCYTGIRAGELLDRPDDDRRNGIRWRDVDLEDGRVTVLSKKQRWDDRSRPEQTIHALRMLERVIDPADNWPVFPTLSPEKLFLPLRAALADDGYSDVEIDEYLSKDRLCRLYSTYELTPDPLQTSGG